MLDPISLQRGISGGEILLRERSANVFNNVGERQG
jgi:hypothetical protein